MFILSSVTCPFCGHCVYLCARFLLIRCAIFVNQINSLTNLDSTVLKILLQIIYYNFSFSKFICYCVSNVVSIWESSHVGKVQAGVSGQLSSVSFLLHCGFQDLNLGHQACTDSTFHAGPSCCGPVINNCCCCHSVILLPHISLSFGLLSCQLVAYTEMYKYIFGILYSSYSGHPPKNLFSVHFIFLCGILALILLPGHSDKLLFKDPSWTLCEY